MKGELILCTDIHVVDVTILMVVIGFGLSLLLYFSYYSLVMEKTDAATNLKHMSICECAFLFYYNHSN